MTSALLLRYALLLFVGGLFTGGVNAGWSINIDCGGTGLTDRNVTWIADTYSSDGSTANNQMQPISGTVASSLRVFQTERTWVSSITYRVPVPEPGTYSVTLYLVEFYWTWVGARLFSVDIQGVRVLQNFDIFQAAAGKNKLITRTFTATVVSSPYTVTIAGQSTRDNPSFTALTIVQLSSSPSPQPPTLATPAPIAPSSSPLPIVVQPPSPSRTVAPPSPSRTLAPPSPSRSLLPPSPSSTLLQALPSPPVPSPPLPSASGSAWSLNIDCGGAGTTDGSVTWIADTYGTGGAPANNGGLAISGPVGGALLVFQTERTWASSYTYSIPVPQPGSYSVTIYFVEFYFTTIGSRVFSVDVQGVRVLTDFDIFRVAGKNSLTTQTFTASVTTAPYIITIAAQSTMNNPSFTALSLVLLSQALPTLRAATATPSQRVPTPLSVPPPVPPPAPHYTPLFPNILRAGAVVGATYTVSSTVRILMPPDCTCQFQLASNSTQVNDVFVVTTGLSPTLFDNSKICGQCLSIYDPVSGRTGVTLAADYLVGQNIQQNQLDIAEDLARYFLDGRIDNFRNLLVTPVMCDWVSYRPEWFLDRGSFGQNVYIQPRYYSRLITAITILGPDGTYNLVQDGFGRWTGAVATRWNPPARWYQFRLYGQGTSEVVEDEFYWDGPPSSTGSPRIILRTRSSKNWAPR